MSKLTVTPLSSVSDPITVISLPPRDNVAPLSTVSVTPGSMARFPVKLYGDPARVHVVSVSIVPLTSVAASAFPTQNVRARSSTDEASVLEARAPTSRNRHI